MAGMKVLISGAGVAGNALGFWLSKLGHNVTIIEQFPNLRTTGLQIDLRGHGVSVLKRMGLEPAFRAKLAPEQGVEVVDKSGKRRAFFPATKPGQKLQAFTTEYEIMRGDLCRVLHDATKDRVRYIFGTSVESFSQDDSSVSVRFTGGETDSFDLLVGADGQWSRTRKMAFGSKAADAFHPVDGLYIGYCIIPRPIQEGEEYIASLYLAPGDRGMMTRRHSPDEIQAYIGYKTDSPRLMSAHRSGVQKEKEALAEAMQGAGWKTQEMLESLKDSDNFYLECVGLVKLESWSSGRVAFVGDAAYCPSVMTGMGTTSAMVGAYVLAGEIGKHCGRAGEGDGIGKEYTKDGLLSALAAYERTFRPFMNQVQKGISEGGGFTMPSTALGISVFHILAGLVSFLKLNVIGERLMREKVKWDLPEYEELLRE